MIKMSIFFWILWNSPVQEVVNFYVGGYSGGRKERRTRLC